MEDRYQQLLKAVGCDVTAGFAAASYGKFQIMGENHEACGYDNPWTFAFAQAFDEKKQLAAFESFIRHAGLLGPLQNGNWVALAKGYNGTAYAKNRYDVLLAQAARNAGAQLSALVCAKALELAIEPFQLRSAVWREIACRGAQSKSARTASALKASTRAAARPPSPPQPRPRLRPSRRRQRGNNHARQARRILRALGANDVARGAVHRRSGSGPEAHPAEGMAGTRGYCRAHWRLSVGRAQNPPSLC
jgi:hypothetical protein